jgi:hypothetical protein
LRGSWPNGWGAEEDLWVDKRRCGVGIDVEISRFGRLYGDFRDVMRKFNEKEEFERGTWSDICQLFETNHA